MVTLILNKTIETTDGVELPLRLELNPTTGKIVDASYVYPHGRVEEIPLWFAEILTGGTSWEVRSGLLNEAEAQESERIR